MRRSPLTLCLLLATLGVPPVRGQAMAAMALPGLDDKWLEASVGELTVWSNTPKRRVAKVVEDLEAFRGTLRLFFPALQHAPRRKTYVYYFDSARQFLVYGADNQRLAGFFLALPEANYIAVDGSTANPYATVFHEYLHYVLRNNVPDLPLWLNEGLAEYFQTFWVDRGQARFGEETFWIQHLATQDWIDYGEVLAARVDSDLYRDPARSSDFRAQAWGLTHLLYDRGSREALIRFMGALAQGVGSEQAIVDAFDTTLPKLETLVRNHLRGAVLSSWIVDVKSLDLAPVPEMRDLDRVEVITNLARLLAATPTDERAVPAQQLFDTALREAPEYVPALVGKAQILLRRGESPGEAKGLLDRALTVDPEHAAAHYFRGAAATRLFEEGLASGDPGEGSAGALLAAARRDFETALALDPHFRTAVNDLAHTFLYEPAAARKGIDLAERELANGPYLILAVTLMELHATVGDRDAARKVHDERIARWLDASAESGVTAISRAIERTDLLVARAWAREGRCREATDLLRQAADGSGHPEVEAELRGALEAMGPCAAEAA